MSTLQPTNASEWQLYKVLQRANLLQYYDTFVAQGGDDVQQLCEAGEEEFLEIMALVGMASKPLHVRRLQKALQEWVANPAAFQGGGTVMTCIREPPTHVYSLPTAPVELPESPWSMGSSVSTPQKSVSPVSMVTSTRVLDYQQDLSQVKKMSTSPQPTPALMENQIDGIAKCATKLAVTLPYFESKPLNMKKDVNKQIYVVMGMNENDPDRLDLCRKYGAIYGRFDSNRKKDKPMSMHEICVNEAAAQLCYHMPTLLTRREDLFPLARQVVKDSGYQYSKGHSRASELCHSNPSKRQKLDMLTGEYNTDSGMSSSSLETSKQEREERLSDISRELSELSAQQEQIVSELDNAKEGQDNDQIETLQATLEHVTSRHLTLLTEQSDLLRKQSYEVYMDNDTSSDRDDSNLGASGSSSPSQTERSDTPHTALRAMLATGQLPKSAFTKAGINNSLFDEGLRIAQQYGLGDFAEELKTLQEDDDEDVEPASSNEQASSEQTKAIQSSVSKNSTDSKDISDSSIVKEVKSQENGVRQSTVLSGRQAQSVNKEVNGV